MELDEESFEELLNQEDSRLANTNVALPSRPLQATIAIFQRYKASGPIFHPFPKSLCFPVTPLNLSDHVNKWYREKYGEKLKIDPSPGRFPILVEGAVYLCRLPLVVGEVMVVGAKEIFKDKRILNAVDYIVDLPAHVRDRLSGTTEDLLQVMFITCLEVTKSLRVDKSSLLRAAKSDILMSCDLLCGYHVNRSLSAWHALQFAEKVFKEYLSRSETFPYTHNIKKLRDRAEKRGYIADAAINWQIFDFDASVRYDPMSLDLQTAVAVNHEAWRIGYNVLMQLEPKN